MTTASLIDTQFNTPTKSLKSGEFVGELSDIEFGLAGNLTPLQWTLSETSGNLEDDASKSYELTLTASTRGAYPNAYAAFGHPATPPRPLTQFGWDTHGPLSDVPEDILQAISKVTDIDLVAISKS